MSGRQPVSVILWPEGYRGLTHLQHDTDVMRYHITELTVHYDNKHYQI